MPPTTTTPPHSFSLSQFGATKASLWADLNGNMEYPRASTRANMASSAVLSVTDYWHFFNKTVFNCVLKERKKP